MKKMMMVLMMVMSVALFAEGSLELKQEVTGTDKQTLEQVEAITDVNELQKGTIEGVEVKLNSNDLKTNQEKLSVAQEVDNSGLEDELDKEISGDKPWWKYVLGGLLLIGGIVAL